MRVDKDGVEWFDFAVRADREAFVRAMDALPAPEPDARRPREVASARTVAAQGKLAE